MRATHSNGRYSVGDHHLATRQQTQEIVKRARQGGALRVRKTREVFLDLARHTLRLGLCDIGFELGTCLLIQHDLHRRAVLVVARVEYVTMVMDHGD